MRMPLLSTELVQQIELSDFEVMSGRMKAIANRSGNPFDVMFTEFGEATAISAKNLPRDFNKLWGFGPRDLCRLDEIVHYYDSRNPDFALDLIPSQFDETMALALREKGFFQYGFHTALYGVPSLAHPPMPVSVHVSKCKSDQAGLFAELFHRSLELPPDIAENEESFFFLLQDPRWWLYIGYLDETPVAFSMMYKGENGVACFGMAGTLPGYRGRGLQSAMLAVRMETAKKEGCQIVTAQTEYGSTSFRNLLKAGFRVAYTKAIWRRV